MSNEKDEKFDEKAMEKQDEKSTEEKSWDEKWARDPLSAVTWALIFIWAGFVLLASNLGWLENILGRSSELTGIEMLDQKPRIGLRGKKIALTQPSALNGITIELSEP